MTSDSISGYGSDLGESVDPDGDEFAGGRPVAHGTVDTVDHAIAHPDGEQPWRELGLAEGAYHRIREILGRRPTSCELAMYAVLWSGRSARRPPAVDLGGGRAVTFTIGRQRQHASVDPGQAAAGGLGGVVRDVLSTGARPVALMDSLRFGALDHPDTARVVPVVVAGVARTGNGLGLPNIGGEVVFDPCYQGDPVVTTLCVGTLRPLDRPLGLRSAYASGVGNLVVLFGGRTGRDGVGDPFQQKVLIECCLELSAARVVTGVLGVGAGGLSHALGELAGGFGEPGNGPAEPAGTQDVGLLAHLDRAPVLEPVLRPDEILTSESPERMAAVVRPDDLPTFLTITTKWDVEATVVGELTDTGRLVILWHGETVVDVPPRSLARGGPVDHRPTTPPHGQRAIRSEVPDRLARPSTGEELRDTVLRMAGSANLCSRAWVTDQYDRYVGGGTALARPDGAGVLRIDEATGLGVALAIDGTGRFGLLDPHTGARLALAEAYRNVASVGARPVAITWCLNLGPSQDPGVRWQSEQAVTGLTDGCRALGVPVPAGDVSFDHRSHAAPIHPTPVVAVLGVLDDVARRTPSGWRAPGLTLQLLGTTREELAGSEWAWVVHGHLGGRPPEPDLVAEQRLAAVLVDAARDGLVVGAHDLSDGGLAQALVEASLRYGVGARVRLEAMCTRDRISPFLALFAESAARVVVAVAPEAESRFGELCARHETPVVRLGETVAEPDLEIVGVFSVGLAELRSAHEPTLPTALEDDGPPPPRRDRACRMKVRC